MEKKVTKGTNQALFFETLTNDTTAANSVDFFSTTRLKVKIYTVRCINSTNGTRSKTTESYTNSKKKVLGDFDTFTFDF